MDKQFRARAATRAQPRARGFQQPCQRNWLGSRYCACMHLVLCHRLAICQPVLAQVAAAVVSVDPSELHHTDRNNHATVFLSVILKLGHLYSADLL